jgi:hypothetical protein
MDVGRDVPGTRTSAVIVDIGRLHSVHGGLVEFQSIAFLDGDSSLRAVAQAGAQPVAQVVAHQSCLAIDHADRPLGA